MTFWAGLFRSAQCLVVCVFLSGCLPDSSGPLDEEKEPHFLAGKNRVSTLDYKGAIECFEKALQANPQSGSAHFELAWLFDVKEQDPAAAIYHYNHYLKLHAGASNAELVKQRIVACKAALAETVSLGPITDKIQRQFEQLTETNKCLLEENKQLHEAVQRWSSYAARLQTLTNQVVLQTALAARAAQPVSSARLSLVEAGSANPAGTAGTSSPVTRTHTVKSGETPSLIARKYGVKLETFMAANPNLDPRRLRVGQVLRIPGS